MLAANLLYMTRVLFLCIPEPLILWFENSPE